MRTKRTGITALLLAIVFLLLSAACVVTSLAWLTGNKEIECNNMQGSIIAQYFHCGTGTPDDPFVITRPVHYYNLVNLYQRMDGFANEPYYFQLGYDLDPDTEGLEVFNYDENGNRDTKEGEEYSKTLNLAYYSDGEGKGGALLPIGTSEKPFVGTFDGSDLTIDNLHIASTYTIEGVTYKTADVGIFGVVSEPLDAEGNLIPMGYVDEETGEFIPDLDDDDNPMYLTACISNVYYDHVTIDLTGADAEAICSANTTVHKLGTGEAAQDTVYVGIIAGHIKLSTQVFDVYLNHTTLLGGHAALSDFGYFGCVESTEGRLVQTLGTLVADLCGAGDEAGFGGSLDMAKLYNRASSARSAAGDSNASYVSAERVIDDKVTGEVTVETLDTTTVNNSRFYDTGDAASGKYYFTSTNVGAAYNFISGYTTKQTKTVTTYTKKDEYEDAYYIHNGSRYLCLSNGALTNPTIAGTTDILTYSNTWAFEGNYIYTYYDGQKYYLNANTNNRTLSVSTSTSGRTSWTKNETTHELTATANGITWYLYEDNGNGWKLDFAKETYTVNDGTHYLVATATDVSTATTAANATRWAYDGNKLYTVINTTKYYLNCTDTISLTTTAGSGTQFSFTSGTDEVITYTYNGSTYYLYHDGNGWWVTNQLDQYTFSKGTTYLRIDENNAVTTGVRNTATKFVFDSTNGFLYTVINGTVVYLYGDTALKTTTAKNTADDIKWQYSAADNTFFYVRGGTTYYLVYLSGAWRVSDGTGLIAFKSGTSYLHANGGTLETSTTATYWDFNGTTGTVSYTDGGTTYYLRAVLNGGRNVELTTTVGNATQWTFAGNELSCTLAVGNTNTTFNLVLDTTSNVWRVVDKTRTYYEIKSNSGAHYLSVTNTSTRDSTTTADATWWMLSNTSTTANTAVQVSTYTDGKLNYITLGSGLGYTTTATNLYWNNNRFRNSNTTGNARCIQYNSGWSRSGSTNSTTNRYTVTRVEQAFTSTVNMETTTVDPTLTRTSVAINPFSYIMTSGGAHNVWFDKTSMQVVTKSVKDGVTSGNPSYFPIRTETDDGFAVSEKNTGYIVGGGYQSVDSYVSDIRISRYSVTSTTGWNVVTGIEDSYDKNSVSYTRLTNDTNYLCINEECNGITNGTDASKATWWSFSTAGTNPSGKISTIVDNKTYYLTYSGGKLTVTPTEADASSFTSNTNRRVYTDSNYIRYNSGEWTASGTSSNGTQFTWDKGTFTAIYTVDGSGNHLLSNETMVYQIASRQLLQTLSNQDYVYGLHFMDAAISKDKLITVDEATILGAHYENYQLPEDSIDFNVLEKGTISFFAGSYYRGTNNTFFSLHHIERNPSTHEIESIKEIEYVYKHKTDDKKAYVYKYKNEAVAWPEGESESDYEIVFKTEWITNPTGVKEEPKVYFFEIPCNSGEYALGSVSGKGGAYLMYLDIAANGGDAVTSKVDEEQNNPVAAFLVDYKDAPDRIAGGCNTVMIAAQNVPASATKDNFAINISFSAAEDVVTDEYPDGLYTIEVTNTTGEDVSIYVYLCDDDGMLATPFGYAYEFKYTNSDRTKVLLPHVTLNYWKSIAGFVIPTAGDAREMNTAEYQAYATPTS